MFYTCALTGYDIALNYHLQLNLERIDVNCYTAERVERFSLIHLKTFNGYQHSI